MTSENQDSSKNRGFLSKIFNIFSFRVTDPDGLKYNSRAYDRLDSPRKDMIKGIFNLSDHNAKDIMIPRVDVVAIDSGKDLKQLVKVVIDAGHSRLPVYEDTIDNIVGIIYAKDLLRFLVGNSKKFSIRKIMHNPYFVPETMPLDDLLLEFKKQKLHLAIVIDEYGGIDGIVTLEDVLEEIVGEIKDEFDEDELPEIVEISTNIYEADPRLSLISLNEELSLNLPTDEVDTLGGFVLDLFGKIPKKDEITKYENVSFKIKEIQGTVINRIVIKILSKKNEHS